MDRKQEIINRQREIDTTISNLYAERKKISAELRDLKKEDGKNSLTDPILRLESKWSQALPTIVLGSHYRPSTIGHNRDGWGYLKADEEISDMRIEARYEEDHSTGKCAVTVDIRKTRGPSMFTTKKTFKDFGEMNAKSPELFYQAVMKAAKKLI